MDTDARLLLLLKYIREEIRRKASYTVADPTITGLSFTYDGTAQGPTITHNQENWEDYYQVTGATATDAGTYTLTFTLINTSKTQWEDQTTLPKTYTYTIGKAAQVISVPSDSISLNSSNPNATFAVSGVHGVVSTVSSDTTVVTASNVGSNVTVAANQSKSGTATVTISAAATDNYLASNEVVVTVTTDMLKIVTWASGTDSEIADMVAASDAGNIVLTNYWAVGDERDIELTATANDATYAGAITAGTYKFVILHGANKYDLVTATSGGKTKNSIVVGAKNYIARVNVANSYDDAEGIPIQNSNWGGWYFRTWCNNVFKGAIASTTMRGLFKQFVVPYYKCDTLEMNSSYVIGSYSFSTATTQDYFAYPSPAELIGSYTPTVPSNTGNNTSKRSYAGDYAKEKAINSQITYYATAANRTKTGSYNMSIVARCPLYCVLSAWYDDATYQWKNKKYPQPALIRHDENSFWEYPSLALIDILTNMNGSYGMALPQGVM